MVGINEAQIEKIADALKNLPESGNGLNFYSYIKDGEEIVDSEKFPVLNHPQAVNFLFFAVMNDYGFWYGDDKGYLEPLCGEMRGKKIKGSDLLWEACIRSLYYGANNVFEPATLQNIAPQKFAEILSDDNGSIIWPDFEARFKMARAYGKWFCSRGISPKKIVEQCNKEEQPLKKFLLLVRDIPGYNADFFEKKNLLLAMVLANRPEKFLNVKDPHNWSPLIDYHLMRLALRLGMVDLDEEDCNVNSERKWVNISAEFDIRHSVYAAFLILIRKSGRQMSFIDEKIWMGRKYCPEMAPPDCLKCIFDSVCKKRVELFQPVFRTTNY